MKRRASVDRTMAVLTVMQAGSDQARAIYRLLVSDEQETVEVVTVDVAGADAHSDRGGEIVVPRSPDITITLTDTVNAVAVPKPRPSKVVLTDAQELWDFLMAQLRAK